MKRHLFSCCLLLVPLLANGQQWMQHVPERAHQQYDWRKHVPIQEGGFIRPGDVNKTLADGQVEDYQCDNICAVTNSQITGKARFTGSLLVRNSNMHDLAVAGDLDAQQLVLGSGLVNGRAVLTHCKVSDTLTLLSGQNLISQSQVEKIILTGERPRLTIRNATIGDIEVINKQHAISISVKNSKITGTVTFKGKAGRVIVGDRASEVNKVENGSLIVPK